VALAGLGLVLAVALPQFHMLSDCKSLNGVKTAMRMAMGALKLLLSAGAHDS
jgi:hypothetical protein